MSELNHRARKILGAVVHEYLATGDAVGSRTITRRHGIDLSPATVRNVMSDLEEAGLLKQPHTSAGRVPTDSGLRFFVDSLLKVRSLSDKERLDLSQRYHIGGDDVESALRDAAHVLAELSTHTAVLVTPRPEIDVLEHVEFVRLRDGQLLAVLVAKSGTVQNKIITFPESLDSEELERIHNYLNDILAGLTLDEVRARVQKELADERVQYQAMAMERKALELSQRALPDANAEVIVSGQARLLENVRRRRSAAAGEDEGALSPPRGEAPLGRSARADPAGRGHPRLHRRRERHRRAVRLHRRRHELRCRG